MRSLLLCLLLTVPMFTWAQHDSLVEVNGIVLSKDSLKPLPAVSIVIKGTGRGTITSDRGSFGIVALLGQEIELTSVGYKPQHIIVNNGSDHAHVVIMETDTAYIATAFIRAHPSKDQFARDFVNAHFEDKEQELAKKSLDPKALKIISKGVPLSASEKTDRTLTQNAKNAANSGTVPDVVGVNLLTLFKGRRKKTRELQPIDPSYGGAVLPALRDTAAHRSPATRDTVSHTAPPRDSAARQPLRRDSATKHSVVPGDTTTQKPATAH
ncbi:carboxypeptidase-like regulatory domain-containing protein [Dinghuibacter silviterrae]|nr:carboxypeptidase-like regulatory domain-containing protein [Dinghuibacter silviterrae]